jgi:hypothetical protein
MRTPHTLARLALYPMLMSTLCSCAIQTAKIEMPTDFIADGSGYPVDGHNVRYAGKPVAFGPYRTAEVKGSGLPTTWTLSGPLFGLGVGKESRRYSFAFIAPDEPEMIVRCESSEWFVSLRSDRFAAQIPKSYDKPALGCDVMVTVEAADPAAMRLWSRGNDIYGTLRSASDVEYRIESIRRIEGVRIKMGGSTGYRFSRDGQTVAVVDVIDKGSVHFASGLSPAERARLAAAASALLMLG